MSCGPGCGCGPCSITPGGYAQVGRGFVAEPGGAGLLELKSVAPGGTEVSPPEFETAAIQAAAESAARAGLFVGVTGEFWDVLAAFSPPVALVARGLSTGRWDTAFWQACCDLNNQAVFGLPIATVAVGWIVPVGPIAVGAYGALAGIARDICINGRVSGASVRAVAEQAKNAAPLIENDDARQALEAAALGADIAADQVAAGIPPVAAGQAGAEAADAASGRPDTILLPRAVATPAGYGNCTNLLLGRTAMKRCEKLPPRVNIPTGRLVDIIGRRTGAPSRIGARAPSPGPGLGVAALGLGALLLLGARR